MELIRRSPESLGLPSGAVKAFVDQLEAAVDQIHSVMVLRRGFVLAEAWWHPYSEDRVHQLYSLTKSFTSIAVGLAIEEGRLALDDAVVSFFPDKAPAAPSEFLRALTVRHLLTMSTGLLHDSLMVCASDPDGDWVRGFLQQKWLQAPGGPFVYDTGASHVLGVLVERVAGEDLAKFLEKRLFQPLGFSHYEWETDRLGHRTGGYGLSLRTADVARFGQLLLQKGRVDGKALVPADWIDRATGLQVSTTEFAPNEGLDWREGYGYQFWRSRHGFRGDGAFGQFCAVIPEHDLVLAVTAGGRSVGSILESAWTHLLPALVPEELPANQNDAASLSEGLRQRHWAAAPRSHQPQVELEGTGPSYTLEPNGAGWRTLRATFSNDTLTLVVVSERGEHQLVAGRGLWVECKSDLLIEPLWRDETQPIVPSVLAGSFSWASPTVLKLEVRFLEKPFAASLVVAFEGRFVRIEGSFNVSMGLPADWPRIAGVLA